MEPPCHLPPTRGSARGTLLASMGRRRTEEKMCRLRTCWVGAASPCRHVDVASGGRSSAEEPRTPELSIWEAESSGNTARPSLGQRGRPGAPQPLRKENKEPVCPRGWPNSHRASRACSVPLGAPPSEAISLSHLTATMLAFFFVQSGRNCGGAEETSTL